MGNRVCFPLPILRSGCFAIAANHRERVFRQAFARSVAGGKLNKSEMRPAGAHAALAANRLGTKDGFQTIKRAGCTETGPLKAQPFEAAHERVQALLISQIEMCQKLCLAE